MIKEMLNYLSDRVRNPWLGSIFLAFIGFNWQALMYLFFANEVLLDRFYYFDANTTYLTLLSPIAVGFVLSVLKPIGSGVHQRICRIPNQWVNGEFWKEKEKNLAPKIKYEKSAHELVLLSSKTDKSVNKITNPDTKKSLENYIDEGRKSVDGSSEIKPKPNLNAYFRENPLLPNKSSLEMLKGAAQCLTAHQGTFSREELFEYVQTAKNWEAKLNRNRKSTFERQLAMGKMGEKAAGAFFWWT